MRDTDIIVLLSLAVVVSTGVAAADSASITAVELTNVDDRDGDGAASSFDLLIRADTSCLGCNDESDDDPQIDPEFIVTIAGETGNDVEFDPVAVEPDDDGEYLYPIPNDVLQQFDTQTLTIHVRFRDRDFLEHETIDETTVRANYETVADDPTPTPTATPTATPTPTPTATPTPTPNPAAGSDGGGDGGDARQAVDGSGGTSGAQTPTVNPLVFVGGGLLALAIAIVVASRNVGGDGGA